MSRPLSEKGRKGTWECLLAINAAGGWYHKHIYKHKHTCTHTHAVQYTPSAHIATSCAAYQYTYIHIRISRNTLMYYTAH